MRSAQRMRITAWFFLDGVFFHFSKNSVRRAISRCSRSYISACRFRLASFCCQNAEKLPV